MPEGTLALNANFCGLSEKDLNDTRRLLRRGLPACDHSRARSKPSVTAGTPLTSRSRIPSAGSADLNAIDPTLADTVIEPTVTVAVTSLPRRMVSGMATALAVQSGSGGPARGAPSSDVITSG